MKRNISILSLLAMLSVGLLSVYAKTDLTTDDWDDDGPVVPVTFLNAPTAEYSGLRLKLTSDNKDASIMWTTRPQAQPGEQGAWTRYTAPINLTEDCTVRFYATLDNRSNSEVAEYQFVYADHQTLAPVISANAEGTVLTMSCATPGAKIRYTDDGSEPDETSPLYTSPVNVSSYIYKAKAFANDLFPSDAVTYTATVTTFAVPVPTAEVVNKALVLSCTDSKAKILYSFDPEATIGNSSAWIEYKNPIPMSENCVVRFFGRREGYNDSDVSSFNFVLTNYRAADPTIERNEAGTHIVMETVTPNGEIRYTVDDTEPTEQSTLYEGPILIAGNITYTAKTFAPGLFESQSNRYVITNMAVPDPYAYFTQKRLSLHCLDIAAEIWYSTKENPSKDNMADWTRYTEPFPLSGDYMLHFFSRRANFNDSDIESVAIVYADFQNIAPTIARNAQGTHVVMNAVAQKPVSGLMPDDGSDPVLAGPKIRYTTDGSEPTSQSALYEAPVRIQAGAVYRARVFDDNFYDSEITEYAIGDASLPVPVAEFRDFAIHLTCSDAEASIWYTSDPDATLTDDLQGWTLYESPIVPDGDCTYRFFAGDDDRNASDIQSYVFQRADHTVMAPTIERSDDGLSVEMATSTPDADIRFTTDGTTPTEMSMLYVEPVEITGNMTFLARAFAEGMYDSEITEFVLNNIAVPVAYARVENKTLILSCADSRAEIWYTTDSSATRDDMTPWTRYIGPLALSQNATFHFFTRRANFHDSDIETFVFLRGNYQVYTPSVYRSDDGSLLVMECETEGAEIRYSTDGSEPTESSTLYTAPVVPEGTVTYRVRAFADGLFESPVAEYSVSSQTSAVPQAVFENLVLVITVDDPEAQIWYVAESTMQTRGETEWLLYKDPIEFTGDCVVRYFSSRPGYNNSAIRSFRLTYSDYQAEMPQIWTSIDGSKVEMGCDDPTAEVRYTLDKSEPTAASLLYTGPLALAEGQNYFRARAFAEGKYPSEIASLDYFFEGVGIELIEADGGIVFCVMSGTRGFLSDTECELIIYNLQGSPVKTVELKKGFNPVTGLASGCYIAAGKKIIL